MFGQRATSQPHTILCIPTDTHHYTSISQIRQTLKSIDVVVRKRYKIGLNSVAFTAIGFFVPQHKHDKSPRLFWRIRSTNCKSLYGARSFMNRTAIADRIVLVRCCSIRKITALIVMKTIELLSVSHGWPGTVLDSQDSNRDRIIIKRFHGNSSIIEGSASKFHSNMKS